MSPLPERNNNNNGVLTKIHIKTGWSVRSTTLQHMQGICVKLDTEHWYERVSKSCEWKVTISWHQQVQTDTTLTNDKPDIIIRDYIKKKHVC